MPTLAMRSKALEDALGLEWGSVLNEISGPLTELLGGRHPGHRSLPWRSDSQHTLAPYKPSLRVTLALPFPLHFVSKGLQSPSNPSCLLDRWPSTL